MMKVFVALLLGLGLTSFVLAGETGRRMRRDLSVDWRLTDDESARGESVEQTDAERYANRTPKKPDGCSIGGTWYNHLGSKMLINISSDGVLSGHYSTAVERETGAAGDSPSRLMGHISATGDSPTFGLTVIWSNGRSVTSWTGQCHQCRGEETLMTTWILTQKMDTCDDYWMSNRIGQDTFKRYEFKEVNRLADRTNTQRQFIDRMEQEWIDDQLDL